MKKVACYIDGFNLYHAIDNLQLNHYKWLDLTKLMHVFIAPNTQEIVSVHYFSAYAYWKQSSIRHQQYVLALVHASGVVPVLGKFKNKDRECKRCHNQWIGHEEKQSDVNLALHLTHGAFYKKYDEAFIVTQDSDFAPALKMVKSINPGIKIKIITPPNINNSRELARIADKTVNIQTSHLQKCLLPEHIYDKQGKLIVTRPKEYAPPSN